MRKTTLVAWMIAAAALVLALGACSDDDDNGEDALTGSDTEQAPNETTPADTAADLDDLLARCGDMCATEEDCGILDEDTVEECEQRCEADLEMFFSGAPQNCLNAVHAEITCGFDLTCDELERFVDEDTVPEPGDPCFEENQELNDECASHFADMAGDF